MEEYRWRKGCAWRGTNEGRLRWREIAVVGRGMYCEFREQRDPSPNY